MCSHYYLDESDARSNEAEGFRHACAHGHLEMARWLVDTFKLTMNDVRSCNCFAFNQACSHGHLETAKWLVEAFPVEKNDALADDAYGFTAACMRGHLETAKCTATSTLCWTGPLSRTCIPPPCFQLLKELNIALHTPCIHLSTCRVLS